MVQRSMQQGFSVLLVILFLVVSLAILFAGHFFIYYSLIVFFKIHSFTSKIILASILTLLPISFIISTILAHWHENYFTRGFYFYSGLWLGILTNLFMAFAVAWLLIWLGQVLGMPLSYKFLGILVIAFTLLYSAYGTYNAYNPQIKKITVKINNLPVFWQGKTAVQLSDIHLGHVLDEGFLKKIVDKTNEQNPDIVFITGDLFDGMDGDLQMRAQPLNDLKAPEGVYFITGNHETYLGVAKAFQALKNTKVKILNDELVNLNGLQLIGVSYPERSETKNVAEVIKKLNFDSNQPSILLYHNPWEVADAKSSGVDLMLCGHTHVGQIIPLNLFTHFIYHGYDYGLHTDGKFSVYTSSGVGTWGPAMRTGNNPEIVVIKLQ